MKIHLLLAATALAVNHASASTVGSWSALETTLLHGERVLSTNTTKPMLKALFLEQPMFAELAVPANKPLLMEMSAQKVSEPLHFVAFCALYEIDRECALGSGLKTLLSMEPTNDTVLLLARDVADLIVASTNGGAALSGALACDNASFAAVDRLAATLPVDWLQDWFEKASEGLLLTYKAAVLGRIYHRIQTVGLRTTPQMGRALASLAGVPGRPREVFLYWSDDHMPGYEAEMRCALEDEDLPFDFLAGLVAKKRTFIQEHIALDSLKVSPKRRRDIEAGLAFPK